MTLAIFIAYISIFPILNNDPGVAPDVRYLSLVYLPLNLIGLIILSKFPDIIAGIKEILRYFMVFSIGLIPIFMIIISINNDEIREFYPVFFQLTFWISIAIILSVIGSIFFPFLYLRKKSLKKPLIVMVGLLIALPFVWQIMTIFLIANVANSYAGYNFWLPVIVHLNYGVFMLIGV